MQWLASLFPNVVSNQTQFVESIWQTLYMLFASGVLVGIIGLILGVALVVTEPGQVLANAAVYQVLDKIVNENLVDPLYYPVSAGNPADKTSGGNLDWDHGGDCSAGDRVHALLRSPGPGSIGVR